MLTYLDRGHGRPHRRHCRTRNAGEAPGQGDHQTSAVLQTKGTSIIPAPVKNNITYSGIILVLAEVIFLVPKNTGLPQRSLTVPLPKLVRP